MDNPFKHYKIKEIAAAVKVSERNTRRSVVKLEAQGYIKGRCRGNYCNWNREFKLKEDLKK